MKARVKGTTDIIEVEFNKDALNACYPPYYDKEHNMYYQPEQLEWIDNDANAEPDYWTRLEHTYAGMAMQGILSNPELFKATAKNAEEFGLIVPQAVTIDAYHFAHALVEKLKEKEERK